MLLLMLLIASLLVVFFALFLLVLVSVLVSVVSVSVFEVVSPVVTSVVSAALHQCVKVTHNKTKLVMELRVLLLLSAVALLSVPVWPLLLLWLLLSHRSLSPRVLIRASCGPLHWLWRVRAALPSLYSPLPLLSLHPLQGHLHTLALLLRPNNALSWHTERTTLRTADDALLALWIKRHNKSNSNSSNNSNCNGVVVIFPGLTGDHSSPYCRSMISSLSRLSLHVVLACGRGCGDSQFGTARPYNARDTGDQLEVLLHVRRLFPNLPVFVVSFSLGANVFVNCLADHADKLDWLAGGVAIGSPWDLVRSSKIIERGLSYYLYSSSFAADLLRYSERNAEALKRMRAKKNIPPLPANTVIRTVRDFDELVTAPMAGYENAMAYYADASSHKRVDQVRIPLLCISAADDPVIDGNGQPTFTSNNPNVIFAVTETGGHLGYSEARWDWRFESWADRCAAAFISGVLQHRETK